MYKKFFKQKKKNLFSSFFVLKYNALNKKKILKE